MRPCVLNLKKLMVILHDSDLTRNAWVIYSVVQVNFWTEYYEQEEFGAPSDHIPVA